MSTATAHSSSAAILVVQRINYRTLWITPAFSMSQTQMFPSRETAVRRIPVCSGCRVKAPAFATTGAYENFLQSYNTPPIDLEPIEPDFRTDQVSTRSPRSASCQAVAKIWSAQQNVFSSEWSTSVRPRSPRVHRYIRGLGWRGRVLGRIHELQYLCSANLWIFSVGKRRRVPRTDRTGRSKNVRASIRGTGSGWIASTHSIGLKLGHFFPTSSSLYILTWYVGLQECDLFRLCGCRHQCESIHCILRQQYLSTNEVKRAV